MKALQKADERLQKYRWYQKIKTDAVFRTLVFSAWGTLITVAFAVYNGVIGYLNQSVWYGAVAVYLIILALQRISVFLAYGAVHKRCEGNEERLKREKLKIYLANGAVFLPITLVLTVITSLLITAQKPVLSDEIFAISNAAYAFYKIIMAIINFVKARTLKDYLVQTVRNTCLIDALLSIILLESTMITTFGEADGSMLIMLTVTSLAVCAFTLALGLYMVIGASLKLKRKN